jgi:hypothetical protein
MPSGREEVRLAVSSVLLPAAAEANVEGSVEGMVGRLYVDVTVECL